MVAWIHYSLIETRFMALRERIEFVPAKPIQTLLPAD
jgi:hypothetical protein